MAGLQSGIGCTMIDSVVLAQHINMTDTPTDRQTDRQLRCHDKCRRANALRRATEALESTDDATRAMPRLTCRSAQQVFLCVRAITFGISEADVRQLAIGVVCVCVISVVCVAPGINLDWLFVTREPASSARFVRANNVHSR